MEKIDINKIRGHWSNISKEGTMSGGNDTDKSMKMIAEKMNEIVEWCNNLDEHLKVTKVE